MDYCRNANPLITSKVTIGRYIPNAFNSCFVSSKGSMLSREQLGFLKRKPYGAGQTKKRAPMHKLPARLRFWLQHWRRVDGRGADYVVHLYGRKVTRLRRSWMTTREKAGLPEEITPHSLRHSRATHLMKNRNVDKKDAAEYLG